MFLYEFNHMDLDDRYKCIYPGKSDSQRKFVSFRTDTDYVYTLWDFGDFFVEMKCSKSDKKVISIEGIELIDERINLYIDFAKAIESK